MGEPWEPQGPWGNSFPPLPALCLLWPPLPFPPIPGCPPPSHPFELSHKQMNLLTAPISSAPGGPHDETAPPHSESQAKQINVRCICCRLNIWKSHFINIFFPQPHPHMAMSSGLLSDCCWPHAYVFNVHSGLGSSVPGLPGAFQSEFPCAFGGHISDSGANGQMRLPRGGARSGRGV